MLQDNAEYDDGRVLADYDDRRRAGVFACRVCPFATIRVTALTRVAQPERCTVRRRPMLGSLPGRKRHVQHPLVRPLRSTPDVFSITR